MSVSPGHTDYLAWLRGELHDISLHYLEWSLNWDWVYRGGTVFFPPLVTIGHSAQSFTYCRVSAYIPSHHQCVSGEQQSLLPENELPCGPDDISQVVEHVTAEVQLSGEYTYDHGSTVHPLAAQKGHCNEQPILLSRCSLEVASSEDN